MKFSVMFFPTSTQGGISCESQYELLIESAKIADQGGFTAIWTPERHFDEFGGIFPNPSLTSAALAMVTKNLELRAGSLISPLHDVIRIVEEWSMVDNLSNGRAAISFGSGWNINDFLFYPDRYANRQKIMYEQLNLVKRLWSGDELIRINSAGKEIHVKTYPRPVRTELPIWITSSGNIDTFESAGLHGTNLLTHLIGQDMSILAAKIAHYRATRHNVGLDPLKGKVSLMLHTYIGADLDLIRKTVYNPFREYLRSAVLLESKAARGGGTISGGQKGSEEDVPDDVMEELLDITFERYFKTASLIGTPSTCKPFLLKLQQIGVDEIACLVDFGLNTVDVLEGLIRLRDSILSGNI